MNPILYIDGYKLDHRRQYPKGTTKVYSNWTARSCRLPNQTSIIFVGLQYFLKRYLMEDFKKNFFDLPLEQVLSKYSRRVNKYLGPNNIGIEHIAALHKLGYLSLEFKALPEGTAVPLRVPMLTVENTLPEFFWLVNYIETLLSSVLWLPCTSATIASRYRKILDYSNSVTGGPDWFVDWQGHDFSFRGMENPEAAALSGLGHLLYFKGTDTLPAIDLVEDYYGPIAEDYVVAGSVAATEHSVMCAGGKEDELSTFNRLIELYPSGIVSIVSDTWDLWNVLTNILPQIKDKIMARDGKVVIRPDSGDPVKIICGDPDAEDLVSRKGVVELLWDTFGGTITDKGFKLLDVHIGTIYGDSITEERAHSIVERLAQKGFASANVVFGIGSYTYQYNTRDTCGFAMKATWVEIDGEGYSIYKSPVTDDGTKNSAKGRLAVTIGDGDNLVLINEATPKQEKQSLLKPVWKDGKFITTTTFPEIRERANAKAS